MKYMEHCVLLAKAQCIQLFALHTEVRTVVTHTTVLHVLLETRIFMRVWLEII